MREQNIPVPQLSRKGTIEDTTPAVSHKSLKESINHDGIEHGGN